ncbi:MAG: sugar transferase [Xenococcaceae cyanobacterium MO_167.B52]|nr:sugar transferase [Xenococcaceae cyanobacterium MO_167.B52]
MTNTIFKNNFLLSNFDRACLIEMPSQFTTVEANSFKDFFQKLCQAGSKLKKIILDFGHTTFIDSSGLIGLCQIIQLGQKTQFNLTFGKISPQVKIVLSLAGLDRILNVERDLKNLVKDHKEQASNIHSSVTSKTKRLLDICGALVGLTITGVLFIPIAIAIKLDSPGAIFFSQIRCGYQGQKFRIWKFRSMVANAEHLQNQIENQIQGPLFKNENAPRITKVGKILRKTSLDEFPQFWNVLRGEMSLVGTRPPTAKEVENYTAEHHHWFKRSPLSP